MKFALLGDNDVVLPLIEAIAADPQHELRFAILCGDMAARVLKTVPSVRMSDDWECLLAEESLDAVIVSGNCPSVLEATKKLAAQGVSLLIYPQAQQGAAFVYEMTLENNDGGGTLFPAFLRRFDPQVEELGRMLREGRLGRVRYFQFDRTVRLAAGTTAQLLSQTDIDRVLLFDVDLLRFLGGSYNQVTAIQSGVTEAGIAMATVALAADGLPEASWAAKPAGSAERWQLTVEGEAGTATLIGSGLSSPCQLHVEQPVEAEVPASGDNHSGATVLERFQAACAGETATPNWEDATHAFEILDATRRSLKRRRTIELHFETTSEKAIFKTQMTAAGCGVLTFTLFGLMAYLFAATIVDLPPLLLKTLRVLWIAPLVFYLALQFLVVIARPSRQDQDVQGE